MNTIRQVIDILSGVSYTRLKYPCSPFNKSYDVNSGIYHLTDKTGIIKLPDSTHLFNLLRDVTLFVSAENDYCLSQ